MDTRKYVLIAISAVLLIGPIVFSSKILNRSAAQIISATVMPEPLPLPEFLLRDQDGATFNRTSLKGKFSLLFFGFTHCPDICPATLQQLSVVRQKLALASHDLPDIVLVSVDPERDTPEVLRQYVGHFGDGFIGVTGDMIELLKLTSKLGIYFEHTEGEGDNYNVNHAVAVLAINEDAAFQALFSAPHDIDSLVNDVQVLMANQ